MQNRNGGLGRRLSAVRLVLCVILVAVAILGRPTPAQACGLGTHHEIVDRAIEKLRIENTYPELVQLLENNLGSVYAGSVFPDWGYQLSTKEVEHKTEAAHKDAFLEGYLGYLLSEDIRPNTDLTGEKKRAIAFLFGLVSHHEADAAWHEDNSTQHTHPLLPRQGKRFENEAAEKTSTDGGGAELQAEKWVNIDHGQMANPGFWVYGAWGYPEEAVENAYSNMPSPMGMAEWWDAVELWTGMQKLAGWHAEQEGEAAAVALFMSDDWIRANLESYPLGGLNDGADKTVASWKQTWDRLTGRPEVARVTISGPTKGPRAQYTFTAAFEPADASPPAGWAWDNGDTTLTTTRDLAEEGTKTLSVTAKDRWGNALATASHTMTVKDWEGWVRDNKSGSTPTLRVESAIAVITGRPGLVVDIHSGGWTATCTTGNKPEYGPNACEFGGLRESTYTIAPRGLGASVQVAVDGVGWALVQFAPTIVSASPVPQAASRLWQGWVVGNTSTWPEEEEKEENSVIIVRVAGRPGVQVTMSGGGNGPQMCETGSRSEYGLYVCRFWQLGEGTYTLQPATSDKQVRVAMDGKGTAFVFFQAP